MAREDDIFTGTLRKVFLAGVGAVAATADKSEEIFNDPIKDLNAILAGMTAEQLEALKGRIDEAEDRAKSATEKKDTEEKDS